MHRRQYIPHSHIKVSRRRAVAKLGEIAAQRDAAITEANAAKRRADNIAANTIGAKVRGFLSKTRKFFTQPIGKTSRAA